MGSSGGHRRLPGGSDHFSLQTHKQTLHHNIYINLIILINLWLIIIRKAKIEVVLPASKQVGPMSNILSYIESTLKSRGPHSSRLGQNLSNLDTEFLDINYIPHVIGGSLKYVLHSIAKDLTGLERGGM